MISFSTLSAFAILSVSALDLVPSLFAEDEVVDTRIAAEVGCLIEHIELDSATAGKLVRYHDGDGTALRIHLQTLVDAGSAKVIDSAYLHVREWGRFGVESVDELIYPTEYDPPFGPASVTGKIAPDADLIVSSAPTAFDVRNLGNNLEIGASVDLGTELITLNFSSNLAEHTGEMTYGSAEGLTVQPTFDVLSTQTNIRSKSGKSTLIAMHTPAAPDGKVARDPSRRVLVMLRATVLKPGPAPVKNDALPEEPYDPDDPFSSGVGDPGNPVQIGTLLEYIKVDAATATLLTREHAADADASEFRHKLDALIADGSAEMLDSSYQLSIAGQRSKVESIHEFIYPTEYDPPGLGSLPAEFDLPKDPTTGLSIIPIPPTAFDVRNVGSTFEVEANIDADLKIVHLNAAPELVRFIDFLHYGEEHALSVQPVFFTAGSSSNLAIPSHGVSLVSMHMARDETATGADSARLDQEHRILVFVKVKVFEMVPDDEETK